MNCARHANLALAAALARTLAKPPWAGIGPGLIETADNYGVKKCSYIP